MKHNKNNKITLFIPSILFFILENFKRNKKKACLHALKLYVDLYAM